MKQPLTGSLRKAAVLIHSLDSATADALLEQMGEPLARRVRAAVMEIDQIDPKEQRAVMAEFLGGGGQSVSAERAAAHSAAWSLDARGEPRRFSAGEAEAVDEDASAGAGGVELDESLLRKMTVPEDSPGTAADRDAWSDSGQPDHWDEPEGAGWPDNPGRQGDRDWQADFDSSPNAHRPTESAPPAPAFDALRQADAKTIARVLQGEHPQTIALVLAHLPPERASHILQQLAPSIQVFVLQRMGQLGPTDPEILRELEVQLQTVLEQQVGISNQPSAGMAALDAILRASASGPRRALMERLARVDEELARRCRWNETIPPHAAPTPCNASTEDSHPATQAPEERLGERNEIAIHPPANLADASPADFAELGEWDSDSLAVLLRCADPQVALLALAGADEPLMERILQPLPPREAARLRWRMEQQCPLRLQDVREAQRRLAQLARRLLAEGRVAPPGLSGFATAI